MKSIKVEREISVDSIIQKMNIVQWALAGLSASECVPVDLTYEHLIMLLHDAEEELEALKKGGVR